jgi:hypothetical protein
MKEGLETLEVPLLPLEWSLLKDGTFSLYLISLAGLELGQNST